MSEPRADPDLNHLRPRLIRLAYRMLGSVAEAEDVVQDAYVRWLATDSDKVRQPAALLHTIVTRLCLNELKSARRRRETYVGPWLPEPIVETREAYADDLTLPLMLALERLSPLERAAFLLHDVFGMDFAEVGAAIGREAAACRKLASRAREHVHAARPRFPVSKEQGSRLAAAFFAASRNGDMEGLRALLAEDVRPTQTAAARCPPRPTPLSAWKRSWPGMLAWPATSRGRRRSWRATSRSTACRVSSRWKMGESCRQRPCRSRRER